MNYTRGNRLPTPGPTLAVGDSTTPAGVILGGGGWIRTTEARASDLQSDPFGHSGTPPEGRTFSRSGPPVSTGLEREFCDISGADGPQETLARAVCPKGKIRQSEKSRKNGAGERNRTPDRLITNQLLYLLSYAS